ncbi:MAG: flagellar motor switch protein FliM [Pseudomonadota bacterium]
MSNDILSQDEVDALLKGVTGEEDVQENSDDDDSVKRYDIGRQERIVRGRMPTLELVHERFARQCRLGFFDLTRRTAEIAVGQVKVAKYSEFIRNLVVPTNLNLIQIQPLRGSALMIFDPNFVFAVVDTLFGGDGQFHMRVEGRDFTPTEQRIIQRMLTVVFDAYKRAWEPVYPIKIEYIRSEMNPQFAAIATPTEVVVSSTFHFELGNGGGDFHICIPYAMIEPIRDILASSLQSDSTNTDERWKALLKSQLEYTEVELVANFGFSVLTLRELMHLQEGDILPLNVPETLLADVDGVPLIEGHYGVANKHYAIKVERLLDVNLATALSERGSNGLK